MTRYQTLAPKDNMVSRGRVIDNSHIDIDLDHYEKNWLLFL